jgi:cell division protein FtsL
MSAVAVQAPRHLRVVDESASIDVPVAASGRRTLVLALMTALVIVAMVFGVVGLNAMAANAAVEARSLERQVQRAEVRYAQLVAEVAAKEDPGRIRVLALELGLVPSPAARHLRLSRGIEADGLRHPDAGVMLSDPLKPVLTQER